MVSPLHQIVFLLQKLYSFEYHNSERLCLTIEPPFTFFLRSFSAGSFFAFARALSVAVYFSSDTNSYLIQHIAVAYVFVLATVPYAPPSSKSARIWSIAMVTYLKVSFISAQKLCCAINGESKYLLSSMQSMVMRREIGNVLWTKSNIWFFVYISCIFKQLQAGIKFYSASGNSFHYKVSMLYLEFPGCGRSAGSWVSNSGRCPWGREPCADDTECTTSVRSNI